MVSSGGKKIFIAFLILSVINLVIFFYRDFFSYKSYADYSSLYAPCDLPCHRKWNQFVYDYPKEQLYESKKILDTTIHFKTASTTEKILAIGSLMYTRFNNQIGKPSFRLVSSSPLEQFRMLSSSDSVKLWCGNFSVMFAYLCWSEGITCRIIEIMNPGNHHLLNECYAPELNKLVMVDVNHNQLLTQTESKDFLNFIDFKALLEKDSSMYLLTSSGTKINIIPVDTTAWYIQHYYKKENPVFYYYRVNNDKVYEPREKIKRYFLPVSWYEIFDKNHDSNMPFYTKQLFVLLWLIVFFAFIVHLLKTHKLKM